MIGLGYRRDFAEEFISGSIIKPDFVEVAPENWIGIGGYWKKQFNQIDDNISNKTLFTKITSLNISKSNRSIFVFILNQNNIT